MGPIWTVSIIQGVIAQKTVKYSNSDMEITLLSRRRHERGGARFYCRGIDDDGNCGNTVESELIITHEDFVYSFVQIRGSIPLFWFQKQIGLKCEISIQRSTELTAEPFRAHITDLLQEYQNMILINLISKTKPEENRLSLELVNQLQNQSNSFKNSTKYIYYDFHEETKGDKFYKINDLLK